MSKKTNKQRYQSSSGTQTTVPTLCCAPVREQLVVTACVPLQQCAPTWNEEQSLLRKVA